MLIVDDRLAACGEYVTDGGVVCDVGTDHGLLVAHLLLSGKCTEAVATDINPKPLKAARDNLEKLELLHKTKLVLCDGLVGILQEMITDIVIAGMGGETIAKIISQTNFVKTNINFVFQPMTQAPYLRKWLCANGYNILREQVVKNEMHFYTIINAVFTGKFVKIDEFYAAFGEIDLNQDVSIQYAGMYIMRLEKVLNELKNSHKNVEKISEKAELIGKIYSKLERNMCTVAKIYDYIDFRAPFSSQDKYDNSGLLIGNREHKVQKIMLALDVTTAVAMNAVENGIDLVISHHPIIYEPIRNLDFNTPISILLKNQISCICAHTNLDMAAGGVNDTLIRTLGFKKTEKCQKIADSLDKDAVRLIEICELDVPLSAETLSRKLSQSLKCEKIKFCNGGNVISRVGICCGGGSSFLDAAIKFGIDAYITGDLKHYHAILAKNIGISLVDISHFVTENIIMNEIKNWLNSEFPNVDVVISTANLDPYEYVK